MLEGAALSARVAHGQALRGRETVSAMRKAAPCGFAATLAPLALRAAVEKQQVVGQERRDLCARADLSFQIAFGGELLVGGEHRVPPHGELACEHPRRGQAGARMEAAIEDRLAQGVIELPVERAAGIAV